LEVLHAGAGGHEVVEAVGAAEPHRDDVVGVHVVGHRVAVAAAAAGGFVQG